jgi:hypothetical protein
MKNCYRIFISAFLVFTVIFISGIGFAADCGCYKVQTQQQHSCCPPQNEPKPCHHQASGDNKAAVSQVYQADCGCVMKSPATATAHPDIKRTIENLDMVSGSIALPTESLITISQQEPVWLRRLYYPDKSELYLDRQHLLL